MNSLTLSDELALLGFSMRESEALTEGRLRDLLKPLLQDAHLDFAESLPRLVALSIIKKVPRNKRERSERWQLTVPGRKFLHSRLAANGPERLRGWMVKAGRAFAACRTLSVSPQIAAIVAARPDGFAAYQLAARLGMKFEPGMTPKSMARQVAAEGMGMDTLHPQKLWNTLLQSALKAEESRALGNG